MLKLYEKQAIKYIACKVGYHKCNGGDTTGKVLNSLGFYWFCSKCESTFTEHYLPKLDRIAMFSGFNKIKWDRKKKQKPINNEDEKDQIPKISKKAMENPPRKEEKQLMENHEEQQKSK